MRVLWVLGEVPIPADSGARLRILGLLKPLAARHDVTAAVLDPGPAGQASLRELEQICSTVAVLPWCGYSRGIRVIAGAALNLLSPLPYSVMRYCTPDTERCLSELAARPFDIIQCENIGFHRYLRSPVSARRVLGTHNVEADVWRQRAHLCRNPILSSYLAGQAEKMARYEGRLAKSYDWVTAVTQSDADRMRNDYGVPNVTVVPNGVDTDYFRPMESPPDPDLVVFSGAMDYKPNDDAIRHFLNAIWPEIVKRRPTARFVVVGRRPAASLLALAARRPGIAVTGWVPDVRPYLGQASAVVVPLRMGGGSRLKILEAIAMARPVVSTAVGAAGLELDPLCGVQIADGPTAFAEAVCMHLGARKRHDPAGSVCRSAVSDQHGWSRCAGILERAWSRAASLRRVFLGRCRADVAAEASGADRGGLPGPACGPPKGAQEFEREGK